MNQNNEKFNRQNLNSTGSESEPSLASLDPTNSIDKHFLNAGAFTYSGYDSTIPSDQGVIVVSDGKNPADNNPHNAQYLFSNKGIRARGYAMSEGPTSNWAKLGTRGATIVVGTKYGGPSAGVNRYSEPQVDFLCDGTADDVEIQAAINSLPSEGGTVLLLDGQYRLKNRITNSKPGVMLRGSGQSTKLSYQSGGTTTGDMIQFSSDASYGAVCDLSIDAQLSGATTGGVALRGAHSVISGVSVMNCRTASNTKNATGLYVESQGCRVENCFVYGADCTGGFTGIFATGEGVCVQNNTVQNNSAAKDCYGIETSDVNTSILDNRCTGNKSTGTGKCYEIYVQNYNARVIGNSVNGTVTTRPHWGIYVEHDSNVVSSNYVSGLYSESAAVVGIEINGSSNAVSANVCQYNTGATGAQNAGIKIHGSQNMVSGNNCQCGSGNHRYTILLDSSAASNVVAANTCNGRELVDLHTSAANPNITSLNSKSLADSLPAGSTVNIIDPDFEQIGNTGQYEDTTDLDNLPTGITIVNFVDGPGFDGYMVLTNMDINAGGYYGSQVKISTGGISKRYCSLAVVGNEGVRSWTDWTAVGGGAGIGDAPNNANAYVRKGGQWQQVTKADVGLGDVAVTNNGGFAGGNSAAATTGAAVGYNTYSSNGGGAVGDSAYSSGGAAMGRDAQTFGDGAAIGAGAYCGGDGFAGGKNATVSQTSAGDTNAIQLGTGTNSAANTLQVYGYRMMEANGKIPEERLPEGAANTTVPLEIEQDASGNYVDVTDLDNLPNGIAMVPYNDGPVLGGYLVFTSVDPNNGGYYGYQIKISPTGTFVRNSYMEVVGTEAKRTWSAWRAQG